MGEVGGTLSRGRNRGLATIQDGTTRLWVTHEAGRLLLGPTWGTDDDLWCNK